MLGLAFCGLGDALLAIVFEIGMLAFAVGHICYTLAFGLEPKAKILGCAFYAMAIARKYCHVRNSVGCSNRNIHTGTYT